MDFTNHANGWMFITQHRHLQFAGINALLYNYTSVVLASLINASTQLITAFTFANTYARAQISGLYEDRIG